MIVLLVVLALGLVAAGGAAIFLGLDILLGDRGLAMIVIGSAVMATGFVLVGLACLVRAVRRLERSLSARHRDDPLAAPEPPLFELDPPTDPVRLRPGFDETGGAAAGRRMPVFDPGPEEPDVVRAPDVDEMPRLPLPEPPAPVMRAPEVPAPPAPTPPVAPAPGPRPAPAPAVEPRPPSVVGRYSSGGNAYVMFTDGSIEADTPTGKHRFSSLDELRAFVAAGGEKG